MSHEISFAYIKSEGIDTTCESDVYREFAERDLEVVQVKDIFMDYIKLRGCLPERTIDGQTVMVRIVETEAYDQDDPASHDLHDAPLKLLGGELRPGETATQTTRVGIAKAADRLRRFYITGNPYVSHRLDSHVARV